MRYTDIHWTIHRGLGVFKELTDSSEIHLFTVSYEVVE